MLTTAERQRIREEEALRHRTKRGLDIERPKTLLAKGSAVMKGLWAILNSHFVLLLLSFFVLDHWTREYAAAQERSKVEDQRQRTLARLDAEITNRLEAGLMNLKIRKRQLAARNTVYMSDRGEIFSSALGALNAASIDKEYKDRDFASLAAEVKVLVETTERKDVQAALATYREMRAEADTKGSWGSKPMDDDRLRTMAKDTQDARLMLDKLRAKRWHNSPER
jgi:hypothetical protein